MVTKTRVEHLNSERAKEFLDEMEEEDMKQNNNGNIPGFLTNFFQGSEQHIKVHINLLLPFYLFENSIF